jgi:hypothetical protein
MDTAFGTAVTNAAAALTAKYGANVVAITGSSTVTASTVEATSTVSGNAQVTWYDAEGCAAAYSGNNTDLTTATIVIGAACTEHFGQWFAVLGCPGEEGLDVGYKTAATEPACNNAAADAVGNGVCSSLLSNWAKVKCGAALPSGTTSTSTSGAVSRGAAVPLISSMVAFAVGGLLL